MISVRLSSAGRPGLQVDRDQRQQKGQKIRKIMSGLGEQRKGMSVNARYHEQHYVGASYAQRNFENSLWTTSAMNVDVHISSVRAAGTCFKLLQILKGSTIEEFLHVAVVVQRGRILDEFQNAVHLVPRLTAHFFELHGHSRSRVNSGDASFRLQVAVLFRENHIYIRTGRQYGAGFHITAAQADVDQVTEHRSCRSMRMQFDG